jgi:tetratricopeptide (TPR) repeat protein
MEDRLILRHARRERRQEYKELAANSCYSLMIVIVALIVLRPLMVDHILSRADAYATLGRLDESQRQCDKALLIDDNSSPAWCQLARIHKTRGQSQAAYDAYQKAVQADATNPSANFELGVMCVEDGQHQMAIPYLEQVRRLGSGKTLHDAAQSTSYHRAALHALVGCYEKVGDSVKTELTLKEIRAFYPNSIRPEGRPQ